MLLVPNRRHQRSSFADERYTVWADGTCVRILGCTFASLDCEWTVVDCRQSSSSQQQQVVEVGHVIKSKSTGALYLTLKRRSGVFTCPKLDAVNMTFLDSLGEGQLHGVGGVFSAAASAGGGAWSTCLDEDVGVVAAGDAWGRIALWRGMSSTGASPPPDMVLGAHGKQGCAFIKLYTARGRMASVGGMRDEVRVWDIANGGVCLLSVNLSGGGGGVTAGPCLSWPRGGGGGVVMVAVGTEDGRLVFWRGTEVIEWDGALPGGVNCLVEYRGLACACDRNGEFAAVSCGGDAKLVHRGRIDRPFVGLFGGAVVLPPGDEDIAVPELIGRGTAPKRTTPAPAAAAAAPTVMTVALRSIKEKKKTKDGADDSNPRTARACGCHPIGSSSSSVSSGGGGLPKAAAGAARLPPFVRQQSTSSFYLTQAQGQVCVRVDDVDK